MNTGPAHTALEAAHDATDSLLHALGHHVKAFHGLAEVVGVYEVVGHLNAAVVHAGHGRWEKFGDSLLEMSNSALNVATHGQLGVAWAAIDAKAALEQAGGDHSRSGKELREHFLHQVHDKICDFAFHTLHADSVPDAVLTPAMLHAADGGAQPTFILPPFNLAPTHHEHSAGRHASHAHSENFESAPSHAVSAFDYGSVDIHVALGSKPSAYTAGVGADRDTLVAGHHYAFDLTHVHMKEVAATPLHVSVHVEAALTGVHDLVGDVYVDVGPSGGTHDLTGTHGGAPGHGPANHGHARGADATAAHPHHGSDGHQDEGGHP